MIRSTEMLPGKQMNMVEPDRIWWSQIGKSLRLIRDIHNYVLDQQSFVVSSPKGFPWEETFEEMLKLSISPISSERLLRAVYPGNKEPDRYCLTELCPDTFSGAFWPSMSRISYLCTDPDLSFHKYNLWIRGIRDFSVLKQWVHFVLDYYREVQKARLQGHAVFLLEYGGEWKNKVELPVLSYTTAESDCRFFGTELLQAQVVSDENSGQSDEIALYTEYLTELAAQLSSGDPELCTMLLHSPDKLLKSPVDTADEIFSGNGIITERHRLESAVWKAQVIHFFPLLEQYRGYLVEKYANEIAFHLPITDLYGEIITDPEDLEFRHICALNINRSLALSKNDEEIAMICRKARNTLSHNGILSFEVLNNLFCAKLVKML